MSIKNENIFDILSILRIIVNITDCRSFLCTDLLISHHKKQFGLKEKKINLDNVEAAIILHSQSNAKLSPF